MRELKTLRRQPEDMGQRLMRRLAGGALAVLMLAGCATPAPAAPTVRYPHGRMVTAPAAEPAPSQSSGVDWPCSQMWETMEREWAEAYFVGWFHGFREGARLVPDSEGNVVLLGMHGSTATHFRGALSGYCQRHPNAQMRDALWGTLLELMEYYKAIGGE